MPPSSMRKVLNVQIAPSHLPQVPPFCTAFGDSSGYTFSLDFSGIVGAAAGEHNG